MLIGSIWYDESWDDHILIVDEDVGDDPGTLVTYLTLDGKNSGKVEIMSKAMLHSMERIV